MVKLCYVENIFSKQCTNNTCTYVMHIAQMGIKHCTKTPKSFTVKRLPSYNPSQFCVNYAQAISDLLDQVLLGTTQQSYRFTLDVSVYCGRLWGHFTVKRSQSYSPSQFWVNVQAISDLQDQAALVSRSVLHGMSSALFSSNHSQSFPYHKSKYAKMYFVS